MINDINIDNNNIELIGFIGIDRHNFYPCISHLFIVPGYRNKKYSKMLVKFCEKIIKELKFNESTLWCLEHLQKYYENMGYSIKNIKEQNSKKNLIMIKTL